MGLEVPLTEYASAYGLDAKDLYNGKAQLVKNGLLPSRTPAPSSIDPIDLMPACVSLATLCRTSEGR
jgi:hypothetical protein